MFRRLPYFSRTQLGVIIVLGAGLLFLWAWRANFWPTPSLRPAPPQNLVFVEVDGVVSRPGVHVFPRSPTLLEALDVAGAPPIAIPYDPTLPSTLPSGSRVEIDKAGRYRLGRMAGPQLLTLGLAIDLNQASQADLEALPGIGPKLAGRIITYRQQHGPFRTIADLARVSGIGSHKVAEMKPYLTLDTAGSRRPKSWPLVDEP